MTNKKIEAQETSALESIKLSRMILPIILGLGVVVWLMSRQLDYESLVSLKWNSHTIMWIFLAIMMYVIRHLFYSWRLRVMTNEAFQWKKAFKLIVLWEFASAVSPTSVGGAGVALFFLAQEKLSTAKSVSVVIYSMVVDTIFFVTILPLLYLLIGPIIIRPGMLNLSDLDGFGFTFFGMLLLMLVYGSLFFYGLFINPKTIKSILVVISKLPFIKKWGYEIRQTARDIVVAAEEMQSQPASFHIKSGLATFGAWTTRFLAINFIIIAFIPNIPLDFYHQLILTTRGAAMHVITSFTPTPGGAGIAEYLFGGFFSDYIPEGVSSLIALIWRLITYYSYLIAGAIVIPVWIAEVVNRRRNKKH